MGQSLSEVYIHLTFGTKRRKNFITKDISTRLHPYVVGILKKVNCPVLEINSMPDHMHILFRMSKNHALSKVVEDVKKISSKWMKIQGVYDFSWQIGYGAFSVSNSATQIVKRYIQNQEEHHARKSYRKEIEQFYKECNETDYQAEYFWHD